MAEFTYPCCQVHSRTPKGTVDEIMWPVLRKKLAILNSVLGDSGNATDTPLGGAAPPPQQPSSNGALSTGPAPPPQQAPHRSPSNGTGPSPPPQQPPRRNNSSSNVTGPSRHDGDGRSFVIRVKSLVAGPTDVAIGSDCSTFAQLFGRLRHPIHSMCLSTSIYAAFVCYFIPCCLICCKRFDRGAVGTPGPKDGLRGAPHFLAVVTAPSFPSSLSLSLI
jgi:hypothetical protein